MSEKERKAEVLELPDDLKGLIRGEVESGLGRFRAGGFDAKLRKAAAEAQASGPAARLKKPSRAPLVRWAPAYGPALAVAVIGLVLLLSNGNPISAPLHIAFALERMPGIQALSDSPFVDPDGRAPASPAESPLRGALAAAARAASTKPVVTKAPVYVPRYTLEQKLEILIKEQPIERALALLKSKSGEV